MDGDQTSTGTAKSDDSMIQAVLIDKKNFMFATQQYDILHCFIGFQTGILKMIAQNFTATATVRKLTFEIENQVNVVLAVAQTRASSVQPTMTPPYGKPSESQARKQFQRLLQQLKSNIIKCISSRLPSIIELEQRLRQKLQDAEEQRQQWRQRYKKIFNLHESNQLQNDQLKIQIITLSDNYESIAKNHQQLKYKYQELKQQSQSKQQEQKNQMYLDKINELNRAVSSKSNSIDSDRENIKSQIEVLNCQRQLFLEEIRQSQHEIGQFKAKMEQVIQEKERVKKENDELEHLLKGEQERCGNLDREIMELIDSNQELKVEKLELKEKMGKLQRQIENLKEDVKAEQQQNTVINEEKEALNGEIVELKGAIVQLKGQNSQNRHKNSELQELNRQLKAKAADSSKQNAQLRTQIEKLLTRLTQTTDSLQKRRIDELRRLTDELTIQKSKNHQHNQQSSKKNHDKVQQISKMHREITGKLQQKILLLEKGSKEKKDKICQLKFEVERLYDSLQIQVEKEYKSAEKIKQLSNKCEGLAKIKKELEEKVAQFEQNEDAREQKAGALKAQLKCKDRKLKKMSDLHHKLAKVVLPNLKQELHNTKLACQHFCKMIQMQKQQSAFLFTARQQNFTRLLSQTLLQRQITTEQSSMAHQGEVLKWKEACKSYEQKYGFLKEGNQQMSDELNRIRIKLAESQESKEQQIEELQERLDKQKLQQIGTLRTVQKLKEKCREVEQYYKLVEQLEKENYKLKESFNQLQTFSFRGDTFNHTKPRQKFTTEPQSNQHSRTTLSNYITKPSHNMNDLTAKADQQRLRLEAVKREYTLMQQNDY